MSELSLRHRQVNTTDISGIDDLFAMPCMLSLHVEAIRAETSLLERDLLVFPLLKSSRLEQFLAWNTSINFLLNQIAELSQDLPTNNGDIIAVSDKSISQLRRLVEQYRDVRQQGKNFELYLRQDLLQSIKLEDLKKAHIAKAKIVKNKAKVITHQLVSVRNQLKAGQRRLQTAIALALKKI